MALAVSDALHLYDPGLLDDMVDALTIVPRMPITEWAETYYQVPDSSQKSGPYRFRNTPWNREIVDRLSPDDPCQDVVAVKPSQSGFTTVGTIWAGYTVHQNPNSFLYVAGTKLMAKKHMSQRVDKLISQCPEIKELFYPNGQKYGVNTTYEKEFPGGMFTAAGTRNPDDLRATAAALIDFDEVETYEFDTGGEGDPIGLAKDRSETFKYGRKHFYASTPLQLETSRIWPLFLSGDRRRFYIPCWHCEQQQYLKWKQVIWDEQDFTSARYVCEHCGTDWTEGQRIRATQQGEWIAEREWQPHMPRSYHLTGSMYLHLVTMPELAKQWIEAQERPEKLVRFIHTTLGECSSDAALYNYESDVLMQRREVYDYPCPTGVQRITAGVDIQDDRIEMVVIGWGWEEEGWILGHHVFYGPTEMPEVWNDLADGLAQPYESPTGPMMIDAVCIDQRYREHEVAAFCRRRPDGHTHKIWPVKGARDDGTDSKQDIWPVKRLTVNRGKKRNTAQQKTYFSINTFAAKQVIFPRCKYAPPGPATWHFPMELGKDFFDQFTSESLVSIKRGLKTTRRWIVKPNRRNEVLDCVVYALAALRGLYSQNFRFIMPDTSSPNRDPKPTRLAQSPTTTKGSVAESRKRQRFKPRNFRMATY